MSGDKTAVTAHLDDNELRRLERFKNHNGHGNPSNAARKAINRGIRDWEQHRDPARSWLLNIGVAAAMLAVASVPATIWWQLDWLYSAAAVYMAILFLLGHTIQLTRENGSASIPLLGRLFGGATD